MSRGLHMFLAILLISQTIFTSLGFGIMTDAEGADGEVVKDVSVTAEEEDGAVEVQVDWSVKGLDVEVEEEETFYVPEEINIVEAKHGDLKAEGEVIGTFSVTTNREVTVAFNEKVKDYPEAEGTFTFAGVIEVERSSKDEADKGDSGEKDLEKSEADEESEKVEAASERSDDEEGSAEKVEEKDKKTKEDEGAKVSDDKASKKSPQALQANDDKHGFNLELDKIMDLEEKEFDEQYPMDPHEEFKLKLNWQLEDGHNYVEGDTETFDLPKGIQVESEFSVELKDESGQVVANAVMTPDKKVVLTFTDYVEKHSNVSGWMEIISKLDIEEVEEEDGKVIIDPIGEEGELRIPIERANKDKTIEKSGEPKGYNADEINWEVIVNKNKTSLTDAKVTDVLPEGTEYKDGSLKVTKLKVDLTGKVLGDGEVVDITPEFGDGGELIIPLGDTNDAYRVEYVTTVTDDEEKVFKNKATITDEELEDVSAGATVTINRGEPLKKGAVKDYDPKTGIIEWYLEFNYNQKDLNDVTLADNWTPADKIELVDGSLKFQEVEIDKDGKAQNVGEPVEPSTIGLYTKKDNGFEVSGITTDKAYYVVYQTKVKERVVEESLRMENTASFGEHTSKNAYSMEQQVGAKSAGNIDYAAKTIEWTIRVNMDHRQMNDVMIEDTIGDGLTLIEDSIHMTIGGQAKTDFELEKGNPFKLTNIGDTDQEIVVTYKTEFDADKVPDRKAVNKANISWIPEGSSDRSSLEVIADKQLNKETQDNSWKNGSYNPATKEITWTIYTNYRENQIANLIVQDEPQENQKIVKDSVVVKELVIAANGKMTEGKEVVDVATIDEDANTFEVNIGKTKKAYKITYKTSLAGLDDMQDEYTNKAEVFDGDASLSTIDAKVGIVKDRKYGNKSGYQDGKQIHWSIDVNLVQQKVNDLKLVDTISENQAYLEDSIKVYHANIGADGKVSKGEVVPADEYDLTVDENEFTVEWKNEVEHAFIVDYSTLFFEKHNGKVGNDYVIIGDSIKESDQDASDSANVTISQLGSGGGEGTAGYLVIDKVDTTDGGEEKLAGAAFDLIDPSTGNILKSGTTDENGQIDFGRLLFGDYQLKETKVPEGYVTPEKEQTIKIDKAYQPGDDKEGFAYTVENYKPVFAIELLKKDASDEAKLLPGAEFALFDAADTELEKATTDKDGKILFDNLEKAGTYYVQETKAPAGYELDDTKHEVTVGDKEKAPVQISIDNEPRNPEELTTVSGKKTWLDDDTEDRPSSITVNLLANGKKVDSTKVTVEDEWKYEFTKLEKNDQDGKEITYTVEEEAVEGYTTTIKGFEITNLRVDSTEVTINKSWKDDDSKDRPDTIKINLLQNGEFYKEYEIKKENDWKLTISDLPKYDDKGKAYEYSVTEHDVAGYASEVDGFDITNTRTETKDIEITKTWVDTEETAARPDAIEVDLFRSVVDGEKESVKTYEVTAVNDWKLEINDLPSFDEDGKAYSYKIAEKAVEGYETNVSGFDISNIRVGEIEVEGTKTWLDDDAVDRPRSITIHLLANGEEVDSTEITADEDWKYEFTQLDKYDNQGKVITYTIEEAEVEGYETLITNFDITNLRVGTTDITVNKMWKDDDAKNRPNTIKVNLLQNNKHYDEYEVKGENDWKLNITDLPKYDETGKAYEYSITEHDVAGYAAEVDGFNVTNTQTDKKSIEITKTWLDDDSKARPETIEVELFRSIANGDKESLKTYELTAEENWSLEVKDLPAFDKDGKAYTYDIVEKAVDGYETSINGFDITNLRVGKTEVVGTKTWKGDKEESRPDVITVHLLRNGEVIDTKEVAAEDDWAYSFTNLEAYDKQGRVYEYSVEEDEVKGYETAIDGFDITNTFITEDSDTSVDAGSKEDPKDPADPDKEQPGLSDSKPSDEKNEAVKDGELPNTATNLYRILFVGAVLFLMGAGILVIRRVRYN